MADEGRGEEKGQVGVTVNLKWTGPFRIRDLLASCLDEKQPCPPSRNGVYLISGKSWSGHPDSRCAPLYIGGNTGSSDRFCTRVGDLIADMHGLFDGGTGHHSGGQSLYAWCRRRGVHPGNLYIGWGTSRPWCGRCAEIQLARSIIGQWDRRAAVGLLNKSRPPGCARHNAWIP